MGVVVRGFVRCDDEDALRAEVAAGRLGAVEVLVRAGDGRGRVDQLVAEVLASANQNDGRMGEGRRILDAAGAVVVVTTSIDEGPFVLLDRVRILAEIVAGRDGALQLDAEDELYLIGEEEPVVLSPDAPPQVYSGRPREFHRMWFDYHMLDFYDEHELWVAEPAASIDFAREADTWGDFAFELSVHPAAAPVREGTAWTEVVVNAVEGVIWIGSFDDPHQVRIDVEPRRWRVRCAHHPWEVDKWETAGLQFPVRALIMGWVDLWPDDDEAARVGITPQPPTPPAGGGLWPAWAARPGPGPSPGPRPASNDEYLWYVATPAWLVTAAERAVADLGPLRADRALMAAVLLACAGHPVEALDLWRAALATSDITRDDPRLVAVAVALDAQDLPPGVSPEVARATVAAEELWLLGGLTGDSANPVPLREADRRSGRGTDRFRVAQELARPRPRDPHRSYAERVAAAERYLLEVSKSARDEWQPHRLQEEAELYLGSRSGSGLWAMVRSPTESEALTVLDELIAAALPDTPLDAWLLAADLAARHGRPADARVWLGEWSARSTVKDLGNVLLLSSLLPWTLGGGIRASLGLDASRIEAVVPTLIAALSD